MAALKNLHVLRVLATLLVVSYHALQALPHIGVTVLNGNDFGSFAMDVFFVMSGFIAIVTTRDGSQTPVHFALRRLIRIVPLYWAMTLLFFALGPILSWRILVEPWDWDGLLKSLFFIPFMSSFGQIWPTLFVGWSLNFEMAFYLTFAAVLALPSLLGRVLALSAVCVVAFAWGLSQGETSVAARFYGGYHVLQFAIGAGVGLAEPALRRLSPHAGSWAVWLLASGVTLYAASMGPGVTLPVRSTIWTVAATMLVIGALMLELGRQYVAGAWSVRWGDATFSIYLVHPLVLTTIHIALQLTIGLNIYTVFILIILGPIASFWVGMQVHDHLDGPVQRWLRHRILHPMVSRAPMRLAERKS